MTELPVCLLQREDHSALMKRDVGFRYLPSGDVDGVSGRQ